MMQNAMGDLPQFSSTAFGANTTTYVGNDIFNVDTTTNGLDQMRRVIANAVNPGYARPQHQQELIIQTRQENSMSQKRRFVQVIVADPNENIPLEDCLLYKGEPKLTDATDQELYFELDIKNLLAAHNVKRITFKDKKVKERVELLEPAKVRDLKMVVVTIAEL